LRLRVLGDVLLQLLPHPLSTSDGLTGGTNRQQPFQVLDLCYGLPLRLFGETASTDELLMSQITLIAIRRLATQTQNGV